jgi:hypothetical protein
LCAKHSQFEYALSNGLATRGESAPSLPVFPGSGRSGPRSLACDCHAHDCVRLSSGRDPACLLSALAMVAAFGGFGLLYGPMLLRHRPDAKPGAGCTSTDLVSGGFHHAFRSSFSRRRSRGSLRRGERGSPRDGDARRTARSGRARGHCRGLLVIGYLLIYLLIFVPRGVVG